jgi:hypothetical protein
MNGARKHQKNAELFEKKHGLEAGERVYKTES